MKPARLAAVLLCICTVLPLGVTACSSDTHTQSDARRLAETIVIPEFHFVREDTDGTYDFWGARKVWLFQDENGIDFAVGEVHGKSTSGLFPDGPWILKCDYASAYLQHHKDEIKSLLGPYELLDKDPRIYMDQGGVVVVVPTSRDIPDIAQRVANVVNQIEIPVTLLPPRFYFVPDKIVNRGDNSLFPAHIDFRRPGDPPISVTDFQDEVVAYFVMMVRNGKSTAELDPETASKFPLTSQVSYQGQSLAWIALLDGNMWFTGGWNCPSVNNTDPGAGKLSGLFCSVAVLGGTHGHDSGVVTWQIGQHTWRATGTEWDGPIALSVTKDGQPLELSGSALFYSDSQLTYFQIADFEALLGITLVPDMVAQTAEAILNP